MPSYRLTNLDARLTYVALAYHLGRPGSELDRETAQPAPCGLKEVARALEFQLDAPSATIELSEAQRARLLTALAGTVNELKAYPLFDPVPAERGGGRRTAAPEFDVALRRLFPQVDDEPEEAVQLAGHLVSLRRRLEAAWSEAAPVGAQAGARRPWWRFWSRGD